MENDLIAKARENLAKLEALRTEVEEQAHVVYSRSNSLVSTSIGSSSGDHTNNSSSMESLGNAVPLLGSGIDEIHGEIGCLPVEGLDGIGVSIGGQFFAQVGTDKNRIAPSTEGQRRASSFNSNIGVDDSGNICSDQSSLQRDQRGSSNGLRVSFHKNVANAPEATKESRSSFLKRNGVSKNSTKGNIVVDTSWQSDDHLPHRRDIVKFIAQMLAARKSQPSRKWMSELPYKAKKLEERLYKSAPSFHDYIDKATLKSRLMKVATEITSKYRDAKRSVSSKRSKPTSSTPQSSADRGSSPIPSGDSNPVPSLAPANGIVDKLSPKEMSGAGMDKPQGHQAKDMNAVPPRSNLLTNSSQSPVPAITSQDRRSSDVSNSGLSIPAQMDHHNQQQHHYQALQHHLISVKSQQFKQHQMLQRQQQMMHQHMVDSQHQQLDNNNRASVSPSFLGANANGPVSVPLNGINSDSMNNRISSQQQQQQQQPQLDNINFRPTAPDGSDSSQQQIHQQYGSLLNSPVEPIYAIENNVAPDDMLGDASDFDWLDET